MEQSFGYSVERVGRAVRDNKRLFLLRCLVSLKETERESLIFSFSAWLVPFLLDMPATNRLCLLPRLCVFLYYFSLILFDFPKEESCASFATHTVETGGDTGVHKMWVNGPSFRLSFSDWYRFDESPTLVRKTAGSIAIDWNPDFSNTKFVSNPPMDFFDMVKSMKMSPPSLLCPLTLGQCKTGDKYQRTAIERQM